MASPRAGCWSLLAIAAVLALAIPSPAQAGRIAFYEGASAFSKATVNTVRPSGRGELRLTSPSVSSYSPAYTPDGRRIIYGSDPEGLGSPDLYSMSSSGERRRRITSTAAGEVHPAPSPNGRSIAFVLRREDRFEIATMTADGRRVRVLTHLGARTYEPAWSPDGRRITFSSDASGEPQIYTMRKDGSGLRRLTKSGSNSNPEYSPGATRIIYTGVRGGDSEIYTMDAGTGAEVRQLSRNHVEDFEPTFSPDGRRIAFVSRGSGFNQVHVMTSDGKRRRQITHDHAHHFEPDWQP